MSLYALARPLLFALDAEQAHETTLKSLDLMAATGAMRVVAGAPVEDPVEVMGLKFRNRVGLAAGLDKNGAHVDAFSSIGFGFIEVGTVTPRPQPGNPRPRMFRIPQRDALINRMGFNNDGVDAFVDNVGRARYRGVLGLNIGKNATTPLDRAVDDYRACLERIYTLASYVAVNVSSPNTKNLRQLQEADELSRMLGALTQAHARLADKHGRRVPMALKIAPDLDADQVRAIADVLVRFDIDAVIATNTTVSREGVVGAPFANQSGGLSGAPLMSQATTVLRMLRTRLPDAIPLIGVGGILHGADAATKQAAGALLVQTYTGLVYRGPALIGECVEALRRRKEAPSRGHLPPE